MSYYQKQKKKVFDLLGAKCAICGYEGLALDMDHVFNDGAEKRREHKAGTGGYINEILRSVEAGEGRIQLLCANCNAEKERRGYLK